MEWKQTLENYEVSDQGDIRNSKTKREIKQFIGKDGYLRTQIAGKTRLVHRIIAKAFIPEEDGREFINHKDGNKRNNKIGNLEWVTKSENQTHAYQHGLRMGCSGIKNGRCRLTTEQVEYIRKNYIPGDTAYGAKALSSRFGVAPQTISAVKTGQNWKGEEKC